MNHEQANDIAKRFAESLGLPVNHRGTRRLAADLAAIGEREPFRCRCCGNMTLGATMASGTPIPICWSCKDAQDAQHESMARAAQIGVDAILGALRRPPPPPPSEGADQNARGVYDSEIEGAMEDGA